MSYTIKGYYKTNYRMCGGFKSIIHIVYIQTYTIQPEFSGSLERYSTMRLIFQFLTHYNHSLWSQPQRNQYFHKGMASNSAVFFFHGIYNI